MLVERYLPGVEVALEGLLTGGELQTLALFDKPDPLEGPFFEETIYVTPSRLPEATQAAISARTAEAAAALGLREGPVHAELRINDEGVWLIEMAGRSIGGLCSTVLEFGTGVSLEELILRHAVGLPLPSTERAGGAAGVMMIPIPKGGMLREVSGVDEALAVPGVTGVEITAPLNQPVTPLPEGASYLGFIFARGETPARGRAGAARRPRPARVSHRAGHHARGRGVSGRQRSRPRGGFRPGAGAEVRRGALATAPFVAGVAPFGMAYAVSALAAGFSPLETFLFSVLACSGSAQMASVGLAASGSGPLAIVLTALGLSLRHVLYGLSLATWLPRPSQPPTPLLAATVFDEGFGLATREAAEGRGSAGFLFGADGLLYLTWVAATLAGVVLGQLSAGSGDRSVSTSSFPSRSSALLLPLIRTRRDAIGGGGRRRGGVGAAGGVGRGAGGRRRHRRGGGARSSARTGRGRSVTLSTEHSGAHPDAGRPDLPHADRRVAPRRATGAASRRPRPSLRADRRLRRADRAGPGRAGRDGPAAGRRRRRRRGGAARRQAVGGAAGGDGAVLGVAGRWCVGV